MLTTILLTYPKLKLKTLLKRTFRFCFRAFSMYELKITSERGKTCTKEVETGCIKGKQIQRHKRMIIQSKEAKLKKCLLIRTLAL